MPKPTKGGPTPQQPKKEIPPTFKVWLEEAWRDWLKSVGLILLIVVAYVAYDRNLLPEGSAGIIAVALIIGGTISATGMPVLEIVEKRQGRLALGAFMAVWALAAGYPSLRRAIPKKELGHAQVAYCPAYKPDGRECAVAPTLNATVKIEGSDGPFEINVSGELRGQGEVEANYRLTMSGANASTDSVEGTLRRQFFRQRTSRRSAATAMVRTENTEASHRLENLRGTEINVVAEGDYETFERGLLLTFHSASLDQRIFLVLGVLCLIVGLVLDFRFHDPKNKVKTYLTVGTAMTLVFAMYYPTEASPHNLVRPAVAGLVAASGGALAGWILAIIVKSFKKQPKKIVTK